MKPLFQTHLAGDIVYDTKNPLCVQWGPANFLSEPRRLTMLLWQIDANFEEFGLWADQPPLGIREALFAKHRVSAVGA